MSGEEQARRHGSRATAEGEPVANSARTEVDEEAVVRTADPDRARAAGKYVPEDDQDNDQWNEVAEEVREAVGNAEGPLE
jgi:hypothetical protein